MLNQLQRQTRNWRWLSGGILFLLTVFMLQASVQAAEDGDCLECHSDPTLTMEKNGKEVSVFVRPDVLKGTVHEENGCVSCHQDADVEEFPHDTPLEKVDCGSCHDDVAELESHSLHGRAVEQGDPFAPSCVECHGKHKIYSKNNPKASTYVMNIPGTCGLS